MVRTGSEIDMIHRSHVRTRFNGVIVNCLLLYFLALGTVFEYGWLHFFLISFDVYISQHYVSHFLTTLSGLSPSFSLALLTTPYGS